MDTRAKYLLGIGAALAAVLYVKSDAFAESGLAEWRKAMLRVARRHVDLGTLYQWGGGHSTGTWGLDCSGLVIAGMKEAGLSWERGWTADLFHKLLKRVAEPQPGDLIVFGSEDHAYHVVIVEKVLDGDIQFIGAQNGSSDTTSPEIAQAKGAFVKRGLLSNQKNSLGFRTFELA